MEAVLFAYVNVERADEWVRPARLVLDWAPGPTPSASGPGL